MWLILKISWRNLWRHRGHSLVIGTILFLGAMIMAIGNGVVSGMDRGLHKTVVNGFTGDLVLVPSKQESDNVFLEMMGRAVEPLHDFPDIENNLKNHSMIRKILPIGKNMAMILNEDGGMSTFLYLLGVDFKKYNEMFPRTLNLLEGKLPKSTGPGLLLPMGARKEIYNQTNIWFKPHGSPLDTTNLEGEAKKFKKDLSLKSSMVMLGFNQDNSTTDIRLNVDGIFRFRSLNSIFGSFALLDIESYRQCLGYFRASERTRGIVSSHDSALFVMEEEGLDALFSEEFIFQEVKKENKEKQGKSIPLKSNKQLNDLDQGAYNLALVLLKSGVNAMMAKKELNRLFKDKGIEVRAVSWKQSLGPVGSMTSLIKGALFLFVTFLFIVAVIIIINTLSMAAMERTPEIGMIRAIGARKGFVSLMFLSETALLSVFFGGLGIITGTIVIEIVALFKISSENDMLQLLFGGDTFRPILTAPDILLAFSQLAMVSLAAVIYPLWLARRITPLDAVYKE